MSTLARWDGPIGSIPRTCRSSKPRKQPGIRAQAPELAGEGDEELVPAIRAAHPGDALVEDAAVEIAVDRRLHTGAQVSMSALKSLLVEDQETLEVVGERPVEDRALGMALACRAYRTLEFERGIPCSPPDELGAQRQRGELVAAPMVEGV